MANLTTISRPYAKAIISLAKIDSDYKRWAHMLNYLSMVAQNPVAQQIIRNLVISAKDKADFINEIDVHALDQQGKNLVKVLAKAKRLEILPALYEQYEVMRRQVQNEVDLNITLAEQVEPEFQDHLQKLLAGDFAASTEVQYELEPDLIGGGKIQVGDRVVESSIRGRLQALYNDLIR